MFTVEVRRLACSQIIFYNEIIRMFWNTKHAFWGGSGLHTTDINCNWINTCGHGPTIGSLDQVYLLSTGRAVTSYYYIGDNDKFSPIFSFLQQLGLPGYRHGQSFEIRALSMKHKVLQTLIQSWIIYWFNLKFSNQKGKIISNQIESRTR